MVTANKIRAGIPSSDFLYTNCISVPMEIFADGDKSFAVATFVCECGPALSKGAICAKVKDEISPLWKVYYRKSKKYFETFLFTKWARNFISVARFHVADNKRTVLFYDYSRSYMTSIAVKEFCRNRIAVIASPAHTSDRLQPLDVSVFGTLYSYVNPALKNKTAIQNRRHPK